MERSLCLFIPKVFRSWYRSGQLRGSIGLKCRSNLIEPIELDELRREIAVESPWLFVASCGASRHQLSKTKIFYEGYCVMGPYRLSITDRVLAKA